MQVGKETRSLGSAIVTGSYVLWGLLPVFWALLTSVNSVFVLAQRVLWSAVFMGVYLALTHGLGEVKAALRDRRVMGLTFVAGALITFNWGIYIYTVASGQLLASSMGYFIEPVLVVLLGFVCFRERPTKGETVTLLFAVAGIGYLVVQTGHIPVLALLVSLPFAVYGAVKKSLVLTAQASLFLETLLMAPLALIFSLWWPMHCGGMEATMGGAALWLLPLSGLVTSVPLLLFNMGIKKVPYYFSGILMYINPTLQFLIGLLVFQEELVVDELISFVIIWVGILFTMAEKIRSIRQEARGC